MKTNDQVVFHFNKNLAVVVFHDLGPEDFLLVAVMNASTILRIGSKFYNIDVKVTVTEL